jgi:putative addiction module component (TIGR02574 family)
MIADDIKGLSVSEKMRILECIWDDFRERVEESGDLSPDLKAILDQRRERVASGSTRVLEWDSVKYEIGRKRE